ncbi:DUF2267 domain-containing protein [Saccharopolyspora rosea]|uniref:DUF2267 domain-containing protein n=1 Tax=Saccharopolyspora rosea TaxID=524884 RepID=A0ABW3G5L0_9PSEU|nr:DUF2267 domain-containing protein [Saccharopolyspora rosea]
MKYDEFLAVTRDRGEYRSQAEADRVARVVLGALGSRLTRDEAEDFGSQLPEPLADAPLSESLRATRWNVDEFLQHVSSQLPDADTDAARRGARAVLSTVADSIDGGQLNHLLTQLPSSYADLFGRARPA